MTSQKKKILYISLIEDPVNNGIINSQALNVLKMAAEAGHESIFFSSPSKKLFLRHSSTEISEFTSKLKNNSIKFYCKPIPIITNACVRAILIPFFVLFQLLVIIPIVIKERPNMLHCRSYPASLIGMIIGKIFKIKYIFDMRGVYPEEGNFLFSNWNKNTINYKAWKIIEKLLIKSSQKTVVVSEYFKQYVSNNFGRNDAAVIYCAPEQNKINKNWVVTDKIKLVYSGTLDGWTTPELLAKTFKDLLAICEADSIFLNIYTSTDHTKIVSAFEQNKIPGSHYKIEKLPAKFVFDSLCKNNIGLLIREPSIVNEVSFPVKFGEYIAAGLPVIINEVLLGVKPFLNQYNLGVTIEDSEKIREIIKNPSNFKQKQSEAVEELHRSILNYLEIYEEI